MAYRVQRPGEKLHWKFDWTDWLGASETIASRQWTITPAGPTLTNATSETVTVEGAAFGVLYRLAEVITTSLGQKGERAISLRGGK